MGFVETVSKIYAGEPSFPGVHSPINGVVGATKSGSGGLIGTSSPLVSLNSDIRDGRTDSMGGGNNSGGERIANWYTAPPNANEFAPRSDTTDAPMSNGRLPYDDCPSESRASLVDPSVVQGTCLKKTARDPWDYLGLGNTLTMEQKALLGCGPYFGTRCGSGERVVAVYYQRDKVQSISNKITVGTLPYPPGDTTPDTGATVYGPGNNDPDVQVVSIAAGTYDIGGVLVELQDSGILGGSNPLARAVKVDRIGKLNPVESDFCELDDLDECTVFGEGGGLDFLNMEGSALIQAFPGVEGTTYGGGWIDPNDPGNPNPLPGARTWVPGEAGDARTYSLDPQPGTTGIPGLKAGGERVEEPILFEGGGVCTRYDPGNPLADASGLVKLPGCRGAQEIVINDDLQTVDVVFERGYTPRQDGCMIQRAMRLATSKPGVGGRSFYYVRPVIQDEFDLQNNQLLDVDLANELAETCWNGGAYANVIGADLQILPFMFDGDGNVVPNPDNVWRSSDPDNPTTTKVDPRSLQPTQFYVDKTAYQIYYDGDGNEIGRDVGNETIRNPKQYDPTFFSYTRRQIYCPRGDKNGVGIDCRLADIQTPSGVGGNPNWTALPTAALYRIRNSRNGGAFVRDLRPNGSGRDPALFGSGATNINELFQLSQGLNANGTINNRNFTSTRVDEVRYFGTGQSIIGAGTLFHPFAMCQNATFRIPEGQGRGTGAGRQRWQDPDSDDYNQADPLVCNYRVRDYENDLLNQNAQIFQNELAAMSWNFMQFLIIASCNDKSGNDDLADADCFNPQNPWGTDRCSYSTPHLCRNVKGFLAVNGVGRNDVRAGGNSRFGRRSFIWDSGAEVAIKYARRNVFGFSADFAEDVTKTNWGMEFTYIGQVPFTDNDSMTNISDSGAVNLTVSIDRPTFINFLNANRTFFMNTQWFFQYLPGHEKNFTSPGPFNTLFTFAVFTGYYQDRLLPQFVSVYDFRSKSGGFLPQLSYRFTEAFSMTFGISWFIGKDNYVTMPVTGIAPVTNRAGRRAYQNGNEQLLNLIKRRDEAFLRLRWTF